MQSIIEEPMFKNRPKSLPGTVLFQRTLLDTYIFRTEIKQELEDPTCYYFISEDPA